MNCVKFVRGTKKAFDRLQEKDINTFYMIMDDVNSQNCHLYIGNRHVDNEYRIVSPSEFSTAAAASTVPNAGEIIICAGEGETARYKIGDGKTKLNALPWLGAGSAATSSQIVTSVVEALTSSEMNELKNLFVCSLENTENEDPDDDTLCFFQFNN